MVSKVSKVAFVLQNIYSDELTDEEFARLAEIVYDVGKDFIRYFMGSLILGDIDTVAEIFAEKSVKILIKKLCKREKSQVAECKVIEKGKIQCEIEKSLALLYEPDKMIEDIQGNIIKYFKEVMDIINSAKEQVCEGE